MRTAVFDVECWDLSPEFAPLICASVLDPHAGEMISFVQADYVSRGLADDFRHDEALLEDLVQHLEQFHLLIGWNHIGFDLPLISTRLVKWGHKIPHRFYVYDGMWACRGWHGIKPKTSKLKDVAAFFGIEEEKPEVDPDTWLLARSGDPDSVAKVVGRCEADARLTWEVSDRLLNEGLGKVKRWRK